ncbi:MAG: hypothetical protein ABIQ09_08330 [Jatrophihabitantaceae bacterium]
MLALIGHPGDPVCAALQARADRVGVSAVTVTDPASWTITVELPGAPGARLTGPSGERISCAVNRGLPVTAGLSAAESSDLLAAWWACLALLPEPVVNRPDATGFVPTPDVRASVLVTEGWLERLRFAGPAVNLHDAARGSFLYRLGRQGSTPGAAVLAATAFDPQQTWRLMLAGSTVVELGRRAEVTEEQQNQVGEITQQLQSAGQVCTLVVLTWCRNRVVVVAANPVPSLAHYAGCEEQVHDALFDWLGL